MEWNMKINTQAGGEILCRIKNGHGIGGQRPGPDVETGFGFLRTIQFMRSWMGAFLGLSVLLATGGARAQSNLVLLVSQPGDSVGRGQTYATTSPADFTLNYVYQNAGEAVVEVQALGFNINIGASGLTVGSYTNATQSGIPYLEVYGNGNGCDTVCGNFQINELGVYADGSLRDLWLTFTQYCECSATALTGEIRYHSQLAPPPPAARTLRVPTDYPTIQAAMNAASFLASDTILVSPGVYGESVDFFGRPAHLVSLAGPAETWILPPEGYSGVSFESGETTNSVVCGFTITNGYTGVSISGPSPTIISNVIVNCATGISASGSPNLQNNTISGCPNGGIYVGGGSAIIQGNVIQFDGRSYQPAITLESSGIPTFINNLVQSNYYSGIQVYNNGGVNIIQNIVVGNASDGIDGAFYYPGEVNSIINNTILGNGTQAGDGTVGIYLYGYVDGSRVFNNIVIGDPPLYISEYYSTGDRLVQFNDLFSPSGNLYSDSSVTNLVGVDGNISADPWFACPPDADYHLLAGSPCIDAGTNDTSYLPAMDFDGNPRILAGTTNGPAIADMGAYEFNPLNPPVPCLYIDCQTDIVEYAQAGQSSVVVSFPPPAATSVATVTCSPPSGSAFPGGTNVVTCTAVYGTNQATCSFNLIIYVPPAITNLPAGTNISAGQTLHLTAGVSGTGPFFYQWYYNQTPLYGTNGATLTLVDVQAANEGLYHVVIENAAGTVTSGNTLVRVVPAKPVITAAPASLTVPTATNVIWSVTATGTEPLTYQWLFNGNPLPWAKSAQLIITNAQAQNAGNYQVRVVNAAGSAGSAVARLTVKASAPYFAVQPTPVVVLAGASTNLTSVATGSNPIKYQWYFNGRALANQTKPGLGLPAVKPAAAGQYYVVAENALGKTMSAVVPVGVVQPPSLSAFPANQVATVGASVTLAVSATGSGGLSYAWQLNGVPLAVTNATLVLTNLQPAAAGFYQVTITNACGSISNSVRVAVLSPGSSVLAWGDNSYGQTNVPAKLTNVVAVAGGDFSTLALRTNGTLIAWGYQPAVPQSKVRWVGIACGAQHSLAIDLNGTVTAWGNNDYGQCDLPAGLTHSVVAVAAGDAHSLALLSSGLVTAWGDNTYGQTTLPSVLLPTGYWIYNPSLGWTIVYIQPPPVLAIAAGRNHNLVVMTNHTVVAWGDDTYGESDVPATLTNVVAVAGGYAHSVALCADGTVTAWGDDSYGQTNVPAGLTNVVAVTAGDFNTLALLANGSVVGWGDNSYGQLNVPATATNAVAIASGYYHSLALTPAPKVTRAGTSKK